MGQLKQLGELRDAGVLTEDEFTAKKTELLDRL
ncbi:SHOCT domain-containing protein [Arthrobacter sp. H14]|nr:SHOCT domain-containing protein [Arthrobacter sp. H14]